MSVEGVKSFLSWDGKVNAAFVVTLILGILAIGFQQATNARTAIDVNDHETRIRTLEGQSERLSRIEAQLSYTTESLARIERRMESK